jgi:hypothetical protein
MTTDVRIDFRIQMEEWIILLYNHSVCKTDENLNQISGANVVVTNT